jgi:hypothetical protein
VGDPFSLVVAALQPHHQRQVVAHLAALRQAGSRRASDRFRPCVSRPPSGWDITGIANHRRDLRSSALRDSVRADFGIAQQVDDGRQQPPSRVIWEFCAQHTVVERRPPARLRPLRP